MISRSDIHHIAMLARIDVSEAEEEHLVRDLEHVLAYVEKLKQAETATVEPLAHILGSVNVMRPDHDEKDTRYMHGGALVEAAPGHRDGYVAVRSVWNGKK